MEDESDNFANRVWCFGTVTKGLLKGLEYLKHERRPSKLQHYRERPEYWGESWRIEGTFSHLNSSERPSANTDMKNSQGLNNSNNVKQVLDIAWELRMPWNIWERWFKV